MSVLALTFRNKKSQDFLVFLFGSTAEPKISDFFHHFFFFFFEGGGCVSKTVPFSVGSLQYHIILNMIGVKLNLLWNCPRSIFGCL